MTNCATEMRESFYSPELAGKFRLTLGLTMIVAGFYIGWFADIPGHGLGLLAFVASPFVFLTDKKRIVKAVRSECFVRRRSRNGSVTAANAPSIPLIETAT